MPIRDIVSVVAFTALTANGSTISSPAIALMNDNYFSLSGTVAGNGASVTFTCQGSDDGTNWDNPDTGNQITVVVPGAGIRFRAAINPPVAKFIRIQAQETNGVSALITAQVNIK